jgi:hypothetical protein
VPGTQVTTRHTLASTVTEPTLICFAFGQKDPDGPVGIGPGPGLGAGAAGAQVLAAAAAGAVIAGLGLGSAVVLPGWAVGLLVGLVVGMLIVAVNAVTTVKVALQTAATAALLGVPIIVVQAPLQAAAAAAVPAAVLLPAPWALLGTPPLRTVLPAAAEPFAAAGPAPLAVPAAVTSAIKLIHHLKRSVILTEGRAALQWGHLDLPGPLDHLWSKQTQWGCKTITNREQGGQGPGSSSTQTVSLVRPGDTCL